MTQHGEPASMAMAGLLIARPARSAAARCRPHRMPGALVCLYVALLITSYSSPSAELAEVVGLYDLPERVEEVLEPGAASALAVNPWGTLLAIGRPDGSIAIFDLQTRGLAATWTGSNSSSSNGGSPAGSRITALLWSASGRALLSGTADGSVTAWDVLTGTSVRRLGPLGGGSSGAAGGAVVHLAWAGQQQQQEANQGLVLVSMAAGPAQLLCLASGQAQPLPLLNLGALLGACVGWRDAWCSVLSSIA